MSNIDIYLLDNLNNTKEEVNIKKPNTYQELLNQIKQKFKTLPEQFDIFIYNENNAQILIDNENKYKTTDNILFIREKKKINLVQSLFQINYNKLPESKQEKLDEKYNCILCSIIIKNENPYLCYKCQKIFHEKCLKDWDNKCKSLNKNLTCPNCRNELPLDEWNKKIDYEENRKDFANLLDQLNKLSDNAAKGNEIINKYDSSIEIKESFRNMINKVNTLHNLLNLEENNKLNELINSNILEFANFNIGEISNLINDELDNFIKQIKIMKNIGNNNDNIIKNEEKNEEKNEIKNEEKNEEKNINQIIDEEEKKEQNNEFKNEIKLTYYVKSNGIYPIFGGKFCENNKSNIILKINDIKESNLCQKCYLQTGENKIIMKIKDINLLDVSYMLCGCSFITNIDDLRYLDVKNAKDLSFLLSGCSEITNIDSLKNWDVSNCTNFSCMFFGCSSLSDIKPLRNWNVSNGITFQSMFHGCWKLKDLKPLENWDVAKSKNLSFMFCGCESLSETQPLEKWNVSKMCNYEYMFKRCSPNIDVGPLVKNSFNKRKFK